ncbi:MAG TPA: hypothetical protein VOA41_08235 [Candidatus Dormibacteraeota bacterium]|nr:hypothetical protein [Candidatus Dormibacteraeota bacterium]
MAPGPMGYPVGREGVSGEVGWRDQLAVDCTRSITAIKESPQVSQIHKVSMEELREADQVESLLKSVTA